MGVAYNLNVYGSSLRAKGAKTNNTGSVLEKHHAATQQHIIVSSHRAGITIVMSKRLINFACAHTFLLLFGFPGCSGLRWVLQVLRFRFCGFSCSEDCSCVFLWDAWVFVQWWCNLHSSSSTCLRCLFDFPHVTATQRAQATGTVKGQRKPNSRPERDRCGKAIAITCAQRTCTICLHKEP